MGALIAVLLIAGIGVFIWKRCDIIPEMCGSTVIDDTNSTAANAPAKVAIDHFKRQSTGSPDHKKHGVVTPDTPSVTQGVSQQSGYAFAHYTNTLGQFTRRLSI